MPKTKTKQTAEASPAPPAARDPLVTLVLWLTGVVLGLQVLRFLYMSYFFITFPYQLDYGEGAILQIALRFARGQSIYPPLSHGYPYVIASYVPLIYVVCGLIAKVAGASFLGGRLVNWLGAMAMGVFCALEVWDRTRHRFAAFAAGVTVTTMPIVMVWGTLMRTDVLGLGLTIAGFYFFQRKHRVAGIILFGLGVLTRWTNLAAMAAILSGLLFARKWREAIVWSVAQIALLALLIFGSNWITHGGMFHQLGLHTESSLGKSWTWEQVWLLISQSLDVWPVYFVLGLLGALWCARRRPHRVLAVYFLCAWAIFFTSGRIGSTFNYLMEPVLAGAMAMGVLWGELAQVEPAATSPRLLTAARIGVLLLAGALTLQMVYTSIGDHMEYSISLLRPRASAAASARVVDILRSAPDPVLCEDFGLIEQAGKTTPLEPFEFTQISHKRAFDPTPVYRDVQHGKFSVIITRFDPEQVVNHTPGADWESGRWPDGIVSALRTRYRLAERDEPYLVYVPK